MVLENQQNLIYSLDEDWVNMHPSCFLCSLAIFLARDFSKGKIIEGEKKALNPCYLDTDSYTYNLVFSPANYGEHLGFAEICGNLRRKPF